MAGVDVPEGLTITVTDVLRAGYCAAGQKRWFPRHDLDYADFLKNGVDAREFVEKGDALAERVVRLKLGRSA